MLTNVAAEYTIYKMKFMAQFFRASGWNLRNLRESVGDGSPITLFASVDDGWKFFNIEDINRLAGEEWKPHQLDLLGNMIVQGIHSYQDLQTRFDKEGAYNLTTIINQTILIDYDKANSKLTAAGGDIFFPNIQGVDG
jgi:uncharacterized protein YvpB